MPIRYFILFAIVEALGLTPFAAAGMGHAGPNGGLLSLISFFLNLPGIFVVDSLSSNWDLPWPKFVVAIFVVQTAGLWLFGLLVTRLRHA